MTNRPEDWPARLALFIEEKRAQPFDWRSNNCCFFACDWLAILTGEDPAAEWRPLVTTEARAAAVLHSAGGIAGMAATVFAARGWPEIATSYAGRGDVCLVPAAPETGADLALGVCIGAHIAAPGRDALVFLPRSAAVQAWRVG
jgi:hypothetical protein